MAKSLFIAEKPSVAREFAKVFTEKMNNRNGFLESEHYIVTWCVGHLVTMSYPEVYDIKYKKWSLTTLPFLPQHFRYEIIPGVRQQFDIVSSLLNRPDVSVIYICTDSGREGEYIYRLVDQMAEVGSEKLRKRVWIDSQTEEEIKRGIEEAKDWTEYDNLSASAYLRAKEDYLMGINFSRLLSLKYGNTMAAFLKKKFCSISVGRVMTCVLGMVVRREREIREFVKTPFYRVISELESEGITVEAEWKVQKDSVYFQSPKLYKENGFLKREDALELIRIVSSGEEQKMLVTFIEKKKEKKNPPLLYNLAELQNDASRMFKISPDETLCVVQELYEKKMVTYPRTDARVLSTAVAKEISNNLKGLLQINMVKSYVNHILETEAYRNIAKTRYVNDKQITDHYAIIPTGQGLSAIRSLSPLALKVYESIVRRFLAIFFPPAVYQKISITGRIKTESFSSGLKVLTDSGYLQIMKFTFQNKKNETTQDEDQTLMKVLSDLKKGSMLPVKGYQIKEGETSPPKRYNSGSMILAMENAGQLIEDEELREQIKGSGIGTSATRAEILKKLFSNKTLSLNKKTQIITPTLQGEMIFDIVNRSIRSLLNPELTASWEKGLTYVAEGSITEQEYMTKLESFIKRHTDNVVGLHNQADINQCFHQSAAFYRTFASKKRKVTKGEES